MFISVILYLEQKAYQPRLCEVYRTRRKEPGSTHCAKIILQNGRLRPPLEKAIVEYILQSATCFSFSQETVPRVKTNPPSCFTAKFETKEYLYISSQHGLVRKHFIWTSALNSGNKVPLDAFRTMSQPLRQRRRTNNKSSSPPSSNKPFPYTAHAEIVVVNAEHSKDTIT